MSDAEIGNPHDADQKAMAEFSKRMWKGKDAEATEDAADEQTVEVEAPKRIGNIARREGYSPAPPQPSEMQQFTRRLFGRDD